MLSSIINVSLRFGREIRMLTTERNVWKHHMASNSALRRTKYGTINTPDVIKMAVYEDITENMAEKLLNLTSITDPEKRKSLIPQLMELKGPIPDDFVSQYLLTYQKIVDDANSDFNKRINKMDEEMNDIRDYYKEKEEEYTLEQEQEDRAKYVEQAKIYLNERLLVADNYRNDLKNYAIALLEEWKECGSKGALVDGYMATKPSKIAMYHQMVQREHEFERT